MKIIEAFLTNNPYYKANVNPTDSRYIKYQKNGPKGIMAHSVGCDQPSANVFVKAWNKSSYTAAAVHGFIDANTGDCYQTMPWKYRAPHAGGNANNTHIGIEMCEPDCINYTSGSFFTCSDPARAKEMVKRTYESAVELFAMLCKEFGFDPLEEGVIISHKEGCEMDIASNHGDPEHLWKGLGMGYTMDGFRKAVKAAMNGETAKAETTPATPETVVYRVQVGAYGQKANAAAMLEAVEAAGFDAIMVSVGGLYKIQVGAFKNKANAEKMLYKLIEAGFAAFITSVHGQVVSSAVTEYTLEQFIRDVQAACGAAVDGIAGTETISKTVTLSVNKNARHKAVKAVQMRLNELDYDCGDADGIFGNRTAEAVKAFQKANGCFVDGIITAENKTWRKLLGMK